MHAPTRPTRGRNASRCRGARVTAAAAVTA